MKKTVRKYKTMLMLATSLLLPVTLLVLTTGTDVWAAKLAALNFNTEAKICKPVIGAGGFIRPARTLAEMSAVSAWNDKVGGYGREYTLWSNAEKKSIRCARAKGTKLFYCHASGAPCKNQYNDFAKFHAKGV